MSFAFTDFEARDFINKYSGLRIVGGPLNNPGWIWNGTVTTLGDYVSQRFPAWGVIVNPPGGSSVLVWYDAENQLHVIDVTGDAIARDVPKAPYHTADESLLYNLSRRMEEMVKALPKPSEALTSFTIIAVAVAVIVVAGKLKGK